MFIVAIVLLVLAAGSGLLVIPKDGYGTRPAPRSHIDPFEPHQRLI